METKRYLATGLTDVLAQRERSIRWFWKKIKLQYGPISDTMVWYIATGRHTCSQSFVDAAEAILDVPAADMFQESDVDVRPRREAVA